MKRPTWLYCGFTSYEQTERLRNTLLVKRISCLVSQSESVERHAALTLQETDSADTQKAVCENMPLPFPATALCKKNITRRRPTWLCLGFNYSEQTERLRITR